MLTRWYRTGAIYSLDAGLFQDSDDDGIGDLQGLIGRLDYLAPLGVTTVMLAEANVSDDELMDYLGPSDGATTRVLMIFAFRLNQAMVLGLARQDARPIGATLRELPALRRHGQWATFLRNHDEIDLGRLTNEEREDVFAEFGAEEHMQLYGRGIRRRLAPMLGGNRRRIELAYSLQLSMPGTPVIRYGEEIGMGQNLDLLERDAIRTPMQWDDTRNAGFSGADPQQLVAPVAIHAPAQLTARRRAATPQLLRRLGLRMRGRTRRGRRRRVRVPLDPPPTEARG
jgi:maltose alpha-D-glucosyltransferase/alpha-amylase